MEQQYLELLEKCCTQPPRETRNGNTFSIFGEILTHDLSQGFPLLTTKRVFFRGVIEELAWFLRGSTNVDELKERGVTIWNKNAEQYDPEHKRDVGGMYGFLWRHFGAKYVDCTTKHTGGIDQVAAVIRGIKEKARSRQKTLFACFLSSTDIIQACVGFLGWRKADQQASRQNEIQGRSVV